MMVVFHDIMGAEDRFVLSKGHAASALYVTLWTKGLLSEADLDTFTKDGTRLSGHPPPKGIAGVEFATGSLGHGLPLSTGMALSRKLRGTPGRVFCMTSDGEWQEGSNWEALIFASHHRLDALTILVDRNGFQGFGATQDVASMHDMAPRFAAFGVGVTTVDGHDDVAIRNALQAKADGPKVILLNTVKGRGIAHMEGTFESAYLQVDDEQLALAHEELARS